jgi:hypothetical protein
VERRRKDGHYSPISSWGRKGQGPPGRAAPLQGGSGCKACWDLHSRQTRAEGAEPIAGPTFKGGDISLVCQV